MAETKGLVVAWTATTEITGDIAAIDQAIEALSTRGVGHTQKRALDARERLVKALGANTDGAAAVAAAVAFEKEATDVDAQKQALELAVARLSAHREELLLHPTEANIKALENLVAQLKDRVSDNIEETKKLGPLVAKAEADLEKARRAREQAIADDRLGAAEDVKKN